MSLLPNSTRFSLRFTAAATIQSADEAALEALGFSQDELVDRGLGLLHPSDRPVVGGFLKALRTSRDQSTFPDPIEVRFFAADGAIVVCTATGINRLDDDATLELACVVGGADDGSETPDETLHPAADFEPIDPPLPNDIGILLRDNDVIDMATGPVQAKLGCHPDTLIGLHLWELVHDDDEPAFRDHLSELDESAVGTHAHYGELRFVSPEGHDHVVDAVVLVRPSGLVVRAREVEAGSSSLDTDLGDVRVDAAVVFVDEEFSVTYVSDSFASVTGRAATGSIGVELMSVVHPIDRPYVQQRLEQPALDGEIHGFVRILADDGTWGWFEVLGRNYLDDPTVGQIALHVTPAETAAPSPADWAGQRGSFSTDIDGAVCFVNARLLDVVGPPEAHSPQWQALLETDEDGVGEIVAVDVPGATKRFLRSRVREVYGTSGEVTGTVGVVTDVTRFVVHGDLPEPIDTADGGSVIVLEQRVLEGNGDDEFGATETVQVQFLSADLAQFVGNPDLPSPLADVFTPKTALAVKSLIWPSLTSDGSWAGKLWLRSARGAATPFQAEFHGVGEASTYSALVASGVITGIDAPTGELGDMGLDRQTLLLSGAPLKRRLERALARTVGGNAMVALALIGVDSIEPVGLGRPNAPTPFLNPADRALLENQVADRLTSACRHDEIAARISDEHYAVLSQRLGDDIDVAHLTTRLAAALEPAFALDDPARSYELSFSVGVASSIDGRRSSDELFLSADNALAAARNRGRTRVVVADSRPPVDIEARQEQEEAFRAGLLAGEIDNVYQPIVARDQIDEPPHRYEALVRWNGSDGAVRGAREVLELANRLNLAAAVGHRVADRALDFMATEQRASGRTLDMNINLGRAQLYERGFVSRLDALLRLYDVSSSQLAVELSETLVVSALPEAERLFGQLSEIGVRVVVDDVVGRLFAAGGRASTALAGVADMKLDRRLVEGVGRNAADTSQVAGLLARAREHHISVTAVGVATGRQSTLLADLGCDSLQGFLIARPASAAELTLAPRLSLVANEEPEAGVA